MVFFVSTIGYAEAIKIPESITGFEKSGGELSTFHLELENMDIASGFFTLPNPETWEPITFEFRHLDTTYTENGFSFLSQYNKLLAFFVSGEKIDENTYDVTIYIKEKDENVMKLEYFANATLIDYEKPIELSMLIDHQDRIQMHRDYNPHIYVRESGVGQKDVNILMEIYDQSGKFVVQKLGKTTSLGYWAAPLIIKNTDFRAWSCYDVLITAEYKGKVIQSEFDFKVTPDGNYKRSDIIYADDQKCN